MSKDAIRDFVGCRCVAIVGASATKKKYGNFAMAELKARGIEVMPIHPSASSIDGMSCCASLASLPRKPDGVFVSIQPAAVSAVLRDAAAAGISKVWLQQGAESPEAETLARELGISLASDGCILMYMQPVRGFHSFHRGLVKLFGRLQPT